MTKQELPGPATKNEVKANIVLKEYTGDHEVKPNIVNNLLNVDQDVSSFPPESKHSLQNVYEGSMYCSVTSVQPSQPALPASISCQTSLPT